MSTPEIRDREQDLFRRLTTTEDPERTAIRDELVTMHMPLVRFLARRFSDRGEPVEDIVQVGMIGLIKAVDRYDVERGVAFSTYATPTIIGEMKRYFRDHAWSVRMPRALQELQAPLTVAMNDLSQELGRSPTVRELSDRLGVGEDDVLDALEANQAFNAESLDAPRSDNENELPRVIAVEDDALDAVEYRESLRPLLAQLPDRDRDIIMLRFFRNMSQSQIAKQMGISQMHVSRILAKSLAQLRGGFDQDS